MEILERDASLLELEAALAVARAGQGCLVLVSGEAGIGKTTLVKCFVRQQASTATVLWGQCDDLFTARPFGPLHDMAPHLVDYRLPALVATGSEQTKIFAAVFAAFQARPTIAVFEDIHWADEATLDLLRFLGRRITRTRAVVMLTYRDDELSVRHPLRLLLGDLTGAPAIRRLALAPLSRQAVRQLVGARPLDVVSLHHQTGGNPFFVTEVLASTAAGLPLTVRDAVLARIARLSPSARAVLEAAAVIGPRIETWLLTALTAAEVTAAEECLAIGILVASGDGLAFRHELARQAVLETIAPPRRMVLSRMALEALQSVPATQTDVVRLAHHAAAADDGPAVLTHAPAAARQAAAAGSHREAAALYALARRFAADLPVAEQAALASAHGRECQISGDLTNAVSSRRQAVALWQAAGDDRQRGESLAQLAMSLSGIGRRDEAFEVSQAAVDLLERLPAGLELALAYRNLAYLKHNNYDLAEAIALVERAIPLAEAADDDLSLTMAYDTLGSIWMDLDIERGRQLLERALAIARRADLDVWIATAYANLGSMSSLAFQFAWAERYLADGLAFVSDRHLDNTHRYMVSHLARAHLYRGRWAAAAAVASEVLGYPTATTTTTTRQTALLTLGRLQARRGDAARPAPLHEALVLSEAKGDFPFIAEARAARAEAAWLANDPAQTIAETDAVYQPALAKRFVWTACELTFWRWRAGARVTCPDWLAEPYARQIAGDWAGAATAWRQQGCPYEEARALADGDHDAQTQALAIFDRLGARPAAAALRRLMRTTGAPSIPRGPRATTLTNRFGLTPRQREILALVATGLTNPEIASQLSISAKTVDHHVSAVLAKLEVTSREAAIEQARRHHLVDEP